MAWFTGTQKAIYLLKVVFLFTKRDMADPKKSMLVAKHIALWHRIEIPKNSTAALFKTCWKWMHLVPEILKKSHHDNILKKAGYTKTRLVKELENLQKYLEAIDSPVVSQRPSGWKHSL